MMRDRRQEDAAALNRYGARYVHLDFLGSQYLRGQSRRLDRLIERIAAALQPHLEGPLDVYVPAGIGHQEHTDVRDAALRVCPDATLYADLPYAARVAIKRVTLPPAVTKRARARRDAVLSTSAFRRKVSAARCYSSQIPPLELAFGDFLTEAVLGREIYWS